MPSSSTILLQKVLGAKLRTWLIYINGEEEEQYQLAGLPASILIQKLYRTLSDAPIRQWDMLSTYSDGGSNYGWPTEKAPTWLQTIVTIEFEDELKLTIKNESVWGPPALSPGQSVSAEIIRIPYPDPKLYKKIFTVIDRAKERAH